MIKAYETCPICHQAMIHSKRLNKSCPLIEKDKFSYVESVCNHTSTDKNNDMPSHVFFQITSLYNELLVEKICFPRDNFEIDVNYVLTSTILTYFNSSTLSNYVENDKVVLKNRLVTLDYPDLIKARKKIKTLALFI